MIVKTGSEMRSDAPVRVVGLQVVVTFALAALALIWGVDAAKAVLLGGAVALLPNAWFAWAVARGGRGANEQSTRQAAVSAGARVLGQWIAKVALTVALMVLVIVKTDVAGLGFFVGLGVALLAQLAVPLVGG